MSLRVKTVSYEYKKNVPKAVSQNWIRHTFEKVWDDREIYPKKIM